MATIRSALSLYDGMTGPLQDIHRALGMVLDRFEAVRDAAGNTVDSAAIQNASEKLTEVGRQVDAVAQSLRNAGLMQVMFNDSVREGTGAWGELAASAGRLDSPDGWTVNNTLEVQTADALDSLERFAGAVGRLDGSAIRAALLLDAENFTVDRIISTDLSLDTAGAVGKYETFAEIVRDDVLRNAMLLNTAGAVDKYEAFAEIVRDDVLGNAMLLNTAGAVDKYETFAEVVRDDVLGNAILLNTARAVDRYEIFMKAVQDGVLKKNLLLNTEEAAGRYGNFTEIFRDGILESFLSLNTMKAVGEHDVFAEAIRDGVLENLLMLSTTGAVSEYETFAEAARDGVLENALLLNAAEAVDKYETFAEIVQDGVFGNALLLNAAGAMGSYKIFAETVRDSTLENVLVLNTVRAVGKYKTFTELVREDVFGNALLLNTAGAVDSYETFTKAVQEGTLENTLLLNAVRAVDNYKTFAEAVRDGVLKNTLLLSTAGAVDKYRIFVEAARSGVLENAMMLDTTDGLDAVSRFLGETDRNSITLHMDVDASRTPAAFGSAAGLVEAWSRLEPVLLGAVGALNLYSGAQMAANAAGEAARGVLLGAAAAFADGTAAQCGLNNAIAACPASWLAVGVNTLITVFYAAVGAVDAFAGESTAAAGVVGGTFRLLGDYVVSGFVVPLWNALASAANFVGNVFNDPVAAVKVRFFDMALTVVGYIRNMAEAIENVINKIPGVTVNITSGLDNFTNGLEQARQQAQENSEWVDYTRKLDRADCTGMDNNVFRLPKMLGLAEDFGIAPVVSFDFGNAPDGVYIAAYTAETDSLDYVDEDLAWMRDLAERDTVNQFTTAEITVEQHNENYISKDTDLDGIMDAWAYNFAQRLDASGEGVHG